MSPLQSDRASFLLATWFGTGRFPRAPGTVATLAAVPVHLLLRGLSPATYWAVVAALGAAGAVAGERVARALGEDDPQVVVIDEVVGTLITLGMTRRVGLLGQGCGLLLFRALDIVKPGVIRRAERLEPKGLGIMADDVLAGIAAGTVTRVAAALLGFSRRP